LSGVVAADEYGRIASMSLKSTFGAWARHQLRLTHFLTELLRVESRAMRLRTAGTLFPWHWPRRRRLRTMRGILVNVGCGPFVLPGFVNVDLFRHASEVVPWDCRWSLPFSDGAAKGIRAEHFFEHLEAREEAPAFLTDCHRVLEPGGVIRIIVPDVGRMLHAYCRGPTDLSGFRDLAVPDPFPDDLPTRMDVVNHAFHQWHEHRWGYDAEALIHRLETAGFVDACQTDFGVSRLAKLAADREEHRPYSLYVEARKPG
jgi:predicted SAM-dependent methyltransferase